MSSAPMGNTPQPGGLIYPPPPPPEALQQALPLAAILGETEEKPIAQIARAIDFLGLEKAEELLQKAQEVYAGEGLLTKDESRKRTLGGCFFRLVRESVTKKQWRKKVKPIAKPVKPPKVNLAEIAKEAVDWKAGVAMSVKITLVGRPDKIRKPPQGHYAAFSLLSETMPILPKGLPTNFKAKTKFLVMVGSRQWNKVEQSILTNEEDKLIIEGYCLVHPNFDGITVLAINCTTQAIRKARQEAQRAESLEKQAAGLLPLPSKKKEEQKEAAEEE